MEASMEKIAVFVQSTKGGVGKTTFISALLDWLRHRHPDKTVAAFDCDPQVAKFANIYGIKGQEGAYDPAANMRNPLGGVGLVNVKKQGEMDKIINSITTNADVLLFDLPGGFGEELEGIVGSMEDLADVFMHAGYIPIVAIVMDQSKPAAKGVSTVAGMWGRNASYLAVKSASAEAMSKFPYFDGIMAKEAGMPWKSILEPLGARLINMEHLRADTFFIADGEEMPFSMAADWSGEGALEAADRLRIARWLHKVMFPQFDGLGILPERRAEI